MATMHDVKPRRKPVTYGKASRKPLQPFTSIESDFAPDTHFKLSSISREPRSKGLGSSKQAAAVETPSLFDVPSSDESQDDALSTLSARKRVRLTPASEQLDAMVVDDETLQRHIAFEMEAEVEVGSSLPSERAKLKGQVKHKPVTASRLTRQVDPVNSVRPKASPSKTGPKQNASTRNSPSRKIPSQSRDHKRTTSNPVVKPKSNVNAPAIDLASTITLSPPISPKRSPGSFDAGLRTPEKSQSKRQRSSDRSSATPSDPRSTPEGTPRQTKLIQDLLEKHDSAASPSRLGLSRLSLQPYGQDQLRKSAGEITRIPLSSFKDAPAAKTQPSRRRLVDALKHDTDEQAEHSSEESSSDAEGEDNVSKRVPMDLSEPKHDVTQTEVEPRKPALSKSSSDTAGPKITYAKQRSYMSEEALNDMVAEADLSNSRHQNALLQSSSQSTSFHSSFEARSAFQEIEEEDAATVVGVKTIHELRQAGGNRRFQDDIDSLFEDIQSSSTGSRGRQRSGLIQLGSKLHDTSFAEQFLANVLDKRLAVATKAQGDLISDCLSITSILLLLTLDQPSSATTVNLFFDKVLQMSAGMLAERRDIAFVSKERQFNMSKAGRTALLEFKNVILKSRIWPDRRPSKLSPQVLALRCIELVVRRVRELGDFERRMPTPIFEQIVSILAKQSIPGCETGMVVEEALLIETTTSILESYTVGSVALGERPQKILQQLSNLGSLLSRLPGQVEESHAHVRFLALRLTLNLTNNNPPLCEVFATPLLIVPIFQLVNGNFSLISEEPDETKRLALLDMVILALASLVNFAEWSATARKLMLEMREGSEPFVNDLLRLFIARRATVGEADSIAQTHSLVPFGYLSVLLCTLCIDKNLREHARSQMPDRRLDEILGAVDEFLLYFRRVEDEARKTAGKGEEAPTNFMTRFENIATQLRLADGGI